MMRFPLRDLLDDDKSYAWLLRHLHPAGLHCPAGHALPSWQSAHKSNAQGVPSYRCRTCGAVYNLFTGTALAKSRYDCSTLVLLLRGIAQGTPTAHLAEELEVNRGYLGRKRLALQTLLAERFPPLRSARR